MYYIRVRDEKKEKWKKKAKINQILFFTHKILGPSQDVYKIGRLAVIGAENSVTKYFLGEKEKWKINGMVSSNMLIIFYTIQQIPNICTNFQIPRHSNSCEIFDTNFPMYYIGVRDGKKEKWKKIVKLDLSILVFLSQNILGHSQGV